MLKVNPDITCAAPSADSNIIFQFTVGPDGVEALGSNPLNMACLRALIMQSLARNSNNS